MTEAPTPTPKPIKNISINIENEGKKYEIILSLKSNNLLIISKELNSFPFKRYEEEFSKKHFNQISKYFTLFNDISEILIELKLRIEEKKFKINMNENIFDILFKVEVSSINEFSIELKRKEEDLKTIVDSLCSIVKIQEEKIKKMEEEKTEANQKKLKEESNNKINKLENEIKVNKEKLLPLNDKKNKEKIFKESKKLKCLIENLDKRQDIFLMIHYLRKWNNIAKKLKERDDTLEDALKQISVRNLITSTDTLNDVFTVKKLLHDIPYIRAKQFYKKLNKLYDDYNKNRGRLIDILKLLFQTLKN